ncbi:D-galactarate dehydratase [Loktanella sp. D2R18]|nr:D-galactarate dehydratase [Loktanella sp. D2R18]
MTETTVVAVAPPASAATVEEFDTTSAEDRAAATAPTESIDVALGVTIASLGPPTEPGIWLKTPLVDAVTPGRVGYGGTSVNLELRPSGGEAGAGSQISLAAMRLLGVPLTSLPELTVYRQ